MKAITTDFNFVHDADSRYGNGVHDALNNDADNDRPICGPATCSEVYDGEEQIGRFDPIEACSPAVDNPNTSTPPNPPPPNPPPPNPPVNDFAVDPTAATTGDQSRYRWASICSTTSRFSHRRMIICPMWIRRRLTQAWTRRAGGLRGPKYPAGATTRPFPTEPLAPGLSNKAGGTYLTANAGQEDSAGTDGLININTAPAIVLATVPFVTAGRITSPTTTPER